MSFDPTVDNLPAALPPGAAASIDDVVVSSAFLDLPAAFYTRLAPTPLPEPHWVAHSAPAARLIGLDPAAFDDPQLLALLAGNRPSPHGAAHAAVYSGHQFGVWAGQLGDGRAISLGDAAGPDGRWEIQLKGAGRTPYSRMGDGRAVLRSSIREFLASEAMAGLGIPTTRALAIVGSDLPVIRESVETAAVVTRLAPSFVRFGSFEHWFYNDRPDDLRALADHVLAAFYTDLAEAGQPYAALLEAVVRRTAHLVAAWQAVGFCHGVLNTDNMSILGLTLDYGPFGFLEAFDSGHICNHSDETGRYAYGRQPRVVHWNLYALGQALVPLIGSIERTQEILEGFAALYEDEFARLLARKLGLVSRLEGDAALGAGLFELLQTSRPDFTLFFRRLADVARTDPARDAPLLDLCLDRAHAQSWLDRYRARLGQEARDDRVRQLEMRAVNPKYVLRNYLAEAAIRRARAGDFGEIERLRRILEQPFAEQPENESYAALPPDWASGLEVSCSS